MELVAVYSRGSLLVRSVVALCLLCSFYSLYATEFPYHFEYITTDEGLPQNTVDYIYKDSRGFMWFATWNGLCRYDGYEFRTFKSGNDKVGLPDNFVQAIAEGPHGLLWVGTAKGISIFNLSFSRFCQAQELSPGIGQASINTLYCDEEGTMWAGAENKGLLAITISQYNAGTGEAQFNTQQTGLAGISVTAVAPVGGDKLWVGSRNGLWEMNRRTGAFRAIPLRSLQSAQVLTLLAEKDYIWIGTTQGLVRYTIRGGEERLFLHDPFNPGSLLHNSVTAICRDAENNLLIGTLGGLNIYQPLSGTFLGVTERAGTRQQLNNKFINSIFADEFGNVWIGTEKGGVNKYNLNQHKFGAIVQDVGASNGLSHSTVNSILIEGPVAWVGTAGGGLNRINRNNGRAAHFRHDPNRPQSISSDFITTILRDSYGNLWIGTWGDGLNKLATDAANSFEHYAIGPPTAQGRANDFISSIKEDPRGFLLIGTESGLGMLDPVSNSIFHINEEMAGVNITEVGCILLDSRNDYWIGTRKGLFRFPASRIDRNAANLGKDAVQCFSTGAAGENALPGNYITALKESQAGRVWIGTYGNGIAYCEPKAGSPLSFHAYDEKDGLCNNVIYCIEEDNDGRLWLSTDYGLSSFDPEKETFKNFYAGDGLLSNQFYWSASFKAPDGNLYFGGVEGLNFFNPSLLKDYPYSPKAAFTKLVVLNSPVEVGEKHHGKIPLRTNIGEAKMVNLSYKDNVFSIEFATLDYFQPEKVQFAYQMEGVDQHWVTVPSSRRFASYTNLKGGEYTFRVKASNGEGQWQEIPSELKFIIHPPFWETGWFRFVFLLLLAGGIISYIRLRTHYLHAQTKKLEQLVNSRTKEIALQKETLQLQAENLQESNLMLEQRQLLIEKQKHELETKNGEISQQRDQLIDLNKKVRLVNQLRLRFFTNISHEFRTPLTLIIDPIESLLERFTGDEEVRRTLHIINRNAQRLLHLINQLMNFRRLEEGKTSVRAAKGRLVDFVKDIFLSFQDLAEHQQIEYSFHLANPPGEAWFDAEKLENIVYNLLSNAFKYTPKKGRITLALNCEKQEPADGRHQYLEIEVRDSGIGIEAEHLLYIFDHFYQAPSTENSRMDGSGIGLALTRELAELMHGNISASSQPGKGSVFTVRLPYSRNAFSEDEIASEAAPGPSNLVTRVASVTEDILSYQPPEKYVIPNRSEKDKPLVLIVEDNYDLRAFLAQSLENRYRILEAENGKDGYEYAKKYTPDLIVSDIMMPYIDGLELCSRLKNNIQTSHIPIILLTAKAMVENWVDGLESGADDYVPKPFNLRILIARINNLIRSRQQLKLLFGKGPAPLPEEVACSSLDEKFLKEAYHILETHYTDQEFSHGQFANKMCMSRSLLYKKIKSLTDMSVTDFINFFKLKKAAQLLRQKEVNISEVAYNTGFSDPKYFSRVFRKFYGMSPSEYASNCDSGATNINPNAFDSRLN
ncbi:MAG: response regulator [Phaeodactylibacter sp.]|nr:response regulator [Phaeodactylibacter sp.]MCB9273126.1 response regulator [Lewinellaceae bacterium]